MKILIGRHLVDFKAKPGAFISKIFKGIPPREVEKFSNLFRSQALKPTFTFEIVSGESIRDFYSYTSYSRNEVHWWILYET